MLRNIISFIVIGMFLFCNISFADLMQTSIASDDYVIADYRADLPRDGKSDVTKPVQDLIDAAYGKGGGVIFFPAGIYRFDGNLNLRQGVSLRGEWKSPKDTNGKVVGTIFAVYSGRNQEKSAPFILMEKVSCVTNLSFWYPQQDSDSIVPYPWTIDVTDESSCGYTVRDVNFVNSYKALSNGADTGKGYNVAYYSNIYGCPLKYGIWIEWVTDITRIDRIYFSPDYWKMSQLPNAPATKSKEISVRNYLYSNGEAFVCRRFDWCPLYMADFDGYAVGVRLSRCEQGESNGEMYGVNIKNGKIGIQMENIQPYGWLFTNCNILSKNVSNSYAVVVNNSIDMTVCQFNTCTIGKILANPKSAVLSFENCYFTDDMIINNGHISIINSSFKKNKKAYFNNSAGDILLANQKPILYESRFKNVRIVKAPPVVKSLYSPHPFAPMKKPAGKQVYSVRDFKAVGDGESDDTEAFKKALKQASQSGGTVYVPAGKYRITEPLKVTRGVELRGIFEGPTHTMVPGSVIFVECGEGEENGNPFITLAESSGIRGLNFWYPNQSLDKMAAYPWLIRATGKNISVRDVSLGQCYQGLDFASADDVSGHVIAGVTGAPLRRGIFLDKASKGGIIEGIQFVIHYWDRNDGKLKTEGTPTYYTPDAMCFMSSNLESFVFGSCNGERIFSTFGYASKRGMILKDNFNGIIHQHGSDATTVGISLYGNARASFVNTLVAPVSPMILYGKRKVNFYNAKNIPTVLERSIAIYSDESFTGDVKLFNSSDWGFAQSLLLEGSGQIDISQIASMLALSVIRNINTRISAGVSFWGHVFNYDKGVVPDYVSVGSTIACKTSFKGDNISYLAQLSSSTPYNEYEVVNNVTDNATSSKMSGDGNLPAWIEMDFEKSYKISGIELMHMGINDSRNTKDFVLYGKKSLNDDWILIDKVTGNREYVTTHSVNAEYQYLRLEVTAPTFNVDNHLRLTEIMVFAE